MNAQVAWSFRGSLLRVDSLPLEWCPWSVRFMCPLCGEVWLERTIISQKAVYSPRPFRCPDCPQEPEYIGLPVELLNHYERSNNYEPLEILSLEFLIASQGFSS